MPTDQHGLIAVLDALGAATYSDDEIDRFLQSRELVLNKLNERALANHIDKARLRVFTFNDTVVIVYLAAKGEPTIEDIETFAIRLRAFMMHSFESQILFRGSLSGGRFTCVDDGTNTVMGPAVSDAAAWYDKADWIGIAATPRTSMFIQSMIERESKSLDHILVDHHVPLNGRMGTPLKTAKLKAINWPKAFYVKGLRPKLRGGARAMILSFLAQHAAPLGTESKYANTIAFFDAIQQSQGLGVKTEVKDPVPPSHT